MRLPPALTIKRGLMALALLTLVGVFTWAMWPKPVAVDVAEVSQGRVLVTVDEEGKTRIKDVYAVSAPITGKVLRLSLDPGDLVKKDDTVVAIIEPMAPPFLDVRAMRGLEAQAAAAKAAVALAEAEVRQAQSELEFAEAELARAHALARSKTISERTLEKARLDADTRRAAVARATSNLEVRKREAESAKARLTAPEEAWKGEVPAGCCVNVRAPVSGRVSAPAFRRAKRSSPPARRWSRSAIRAISEILVELLSADAVKVREGAEATVEGWGGPPLAAKVVRVEPCRLHQGLCPRHRGAARAHDPGAAGGPLRPRPGSDTSSVYS